MGIEGPTGEHEPTEWRTDDADQQVAPGASGSPESAQKQIDFSVDDDIEELRRVTLTPAQEEYEQW
jgi:hypothetical protein